MLKTKISHEKGYLKNGDDEVRTHDPHNAIVVLFQLSYVPESYEYEQKNYSKSSVLE